MCVFKSHQEGGGKVSWFLIFSSKGGRGGQAYSEIFDYVWKNMLNWPNINGFYSSVGQFLHEKKSWLHLVLWEKNNSQTWNFVKNKMLTLLLGVDSFKLHNMVTDNFFSSTLQEESCWSHGSTYAIRFVSVRHHIMQFEFTPLCLVLLYKLCPTSDVLISFLYIAAKPKHIEMLLPTENWLHNIRWF